jgi:phosphate-selective porin OprO and OprP
MAPVASLAATRRYPSRWRTGLIVLASCAVLTPGTASSQDLTPSPSGPETAGASQATAAQSASDTPHASAAPLTAALQSAPGATQGPAEQPRPQTVTAGWNDGFVIQSATGDYRLQIGVLLQADGRFALNDDDGAVIDTFGLRRIRPYLRGRVAQRFEFYVNPDFAGGILVVQDAYLDTRFSPAFIVRLGKGKAPFGLERLMPVAGILFFERAFPTALVPNRDVGVQVLGDIPGGVISYAAAVMNGVPDGGIGDLDTNDGKDLLGRIVIRPFGPLSKRPLSGLSVGIAGSTGNQSGPLATIRTAALLETFLGYAGATADGRLSRYSPQASYFFQRAAALAEDVHTTVPAKRGTVRQELTHDAWQIAGAFVLTGGDTATERGVRPQHNFDFGHGHLGALQVAARYHKLDVNPEALTQGIASDGSSREAKGWTVGLNWYLNPVLKYVVNFERTVFEGNDGAAHRVRNAIAFRGQVSF